MKSTHTYKFFEVSCGINDLRILGTDLQNIGIGLNSVLCYVWAKCRYVRKSTVLRFSESTYVRSSFGTPLGMILVRNTSGQKSNRTRSATRRSDDFTAVRKMCKSVDISISISGNRPAHAKHHTHRRTHLRF